MDDVLAGLIRFTLGGQPFAMAALPMGAHDRWQDGLDQKLQASLDAVPVPTSGPALARTLSTAFRAQREQLLDALIAYDRDGVLPTREEIRELATQQDVIAAIREVRAVGGDPLAVSALSALRVLQRSPTANNGSTPAFAPSSGSPPSTGGRRRKSKRR